MPSGLTSRLYEGTDTTLKGYAQQCALHYWNLRDIAFNEDGTVDFGETNYHQEKLNEAKKELEQFKSLSDEWKDKYYEEYVREQTERRDKAIAENTALAQRYSNMQCKLLSWDVPDSLKDFKGYMSKILKESIDADLTSEEDFNRIYRVVSKEEYVEKRIKELESNVDYHEERLNEIIDDQNRVNSILKELYTSLEEFKKANPET
jgi:hypothetical protein